MSRRHSRRGLVPPRGPPSRSRPEQAPGELARPPTSGHRAMPGGRSRRTDGHLRSVQRRPGRERKPATRPHRSAGPSPKRQPSTSTRSKASPCRRSTGSRWSRTSSRSWTRLAASIPADQHVVFFPTFSAAVLTADEAERQGTPILHLAEPRSEDAADRRALPAAVVPLADRARPAVGAQGGQERRPDRLRSVLPHGHRRGRAVRDAATRRCWKTCCWPRSTWRPPRSRRPSRSKARSTGWPIAASVRPTAAFAATSPGWTARWW